MLDDGCSVGNLLPCNELAALRKIIDIFAPCEGVAAGRVRSGIFLLFLALFGACLRGVIGNWVARLAAMDSLRYREFSDAIVGLDISTCAIRAA